MADSLTNLDAIDGTLLLDNFGGTGAIAGRAPDVSADGASSAWSGISSGTVSGGLTSEFASPFMMFNVSGPVIARCVDEGIRLDICFRTAASFTGFTSALILYTEANTGSGIAEGASITVYPSSSGSPRVTVLHFTQNKSTDEYVSQVSNDIPISEFIGGSQDCWITLFSPKNSNTKEVFWSGEKVGEYVFDTTGINAFTSFLAVAALGNIGGVNAVRIAAYGDAGPPPAFWANFVKTREANE
jgi:hypothetical protein